MPKSYSKRLAVFFHNSRRLLLTDFGIACCLVAAWQLILTLTGYIVDTQLHLPSTDLFATMPKGILGHTLRWDAGWYMEIIRSDFYQHTSSQGAVFAFYPLYPLCVALVGSLLLGSISLQTASFIVTTTATALSIAALLKICHHFQIQRKVALTAVLIFLLSPAAMFLHVFYSEAVFIALGSWAYLFALRRQWRKMGLILAALTAARLPGLLFVALCGLEYLRAYHWQLRTSLANKSLFWFLLAPVGFVAYSIWCYAVTGDAFAMFHAYSAPDGWPYQAFNPNVFATILHATAGLVQDLQVHGLIHPLIVNGVLPLASIGVLVTTSLYALIRLRGAYIPLGVFGLLSVVLFTLNSNVISVHRYTLACISIFIIAAAFVARHNRTWRLVYALLPVSFATQLGLVILYITGHFAG